MLNTFRSKLILIVVTATSSMLLVMLLSLLIGERKASELSNLERRLVPKVELGPRLESEFTKLRQALQDAVAAQDEVALEATLAAKTRVIDAVTHSGEALEPAQAAALRWAIHEYYETARAVSNRMIGGETGEGLVEEIARMQALQARAQALIERSTRLQRNELHHAFAGVHASNREADWLRLWVGVAALLLVIGLSVWVGRNLISGVHALSRGLSRFKTGDFTEVIPISSDDELGRVCSDANEMAAGLKQLAEQRDRTDWHRAGLASLSDELRGETELTRVAEKAVAFLAERVGGCAGALYLRAEGDQLDLTASYGLEGAADLTRTLRLGERLTGQAAMREDVLIVDDVPEGYLTVRSVLGEGEPAVLVFLPLWDFGKPIGIVELALFKNCSAEERDFLASARRTLVIAIVAAQARAAERELLARTQEQAERLAAQEEELKLNNQELLVQQEELRVANEELEEQWKTVAQQNTELTQARERLQQKAAELTTVSSYKSQFLANMSHELRTPLNSMLLLSHLLAENEAGNLTAKQVEHAKTIHSAGEDLLGLINQVLDLAKIEAGRQDLHVESIAIDHFVGYARRVFEPMAADKGLRLVVEVAPGLPPEIVTDEQRVERILTNLLGNAIKFTVQGQVTLHIGWAAADQTFLRADLAANQVVAFAVTDTGVGIVPEALERVFAPFEQLESEANRRFAGTGLGLAIARESATLLGGELQVKSAFGKGSTFTLFLPSRRQSADDAVQPAPEAAQRPADDRASPSTDRPELLVIEDDVVLVEQLVDIIHARRLQVLIAATGDEGLRLARERKPQGIILDVKLPDIDGWTVMERLRQDPVTRAIPVHFVSAVDAPQRALALGAVGYLVKPATHAALAGVVRILAPVRQGSKRILVVEDNVREGESVVELLNHDGWSAHHVASGKAAIIALEQESFGCMIVDLGLPDMDGLGLLEVLRQRSGIDPPRVIVHTARTLSKKEAQQLEFYAQAVVMKDGNSADRLLEEVRLFVHHIKDRLPTSVRSGQVTPPAADISLEGATILLAEDDMRTVYALSALLQGKGATVLIADTGREALEMLSGHPEIDLVLMDIMMPEMDGYEAIRTLRSDARFARLPVIALTAKAMKGERERCLETGANGYISKPVDGDNLLAALSTWLTADDNHGATQQG